jgi:5'-methylthioadenosine phosphorylase
MPAPTGPVGVAVVGGSGFYEFLSDVTEVEVDTPYGAPAAPVAVGEVDGTAVAFLPRHGAGHAFPPHLIPYRANLWALRSLGVRQVLAPCAVGGLRAEVAPGDLVVPDQLVDRTSGRPQSYVESGAVHVPFADPYCPALSAALAAHDGVAHGGTMVVVEGPRFSTRAESQSYAAAGWTLVNMTGHPEAVLARELQMCYTTIALVTDMDAGVEAGEGVAQAEVFAMFARNIDRVKDLLAATVATLPTPGAGCGCASWADGLALPYQVPGAQERAQKDAQEGEPKGAQEGEPKGAQEGEQ